jgi:hypothetical protein
MRERELFTENVMMGVYTGLFPCFGFKDFAIPSHLDLLAHLYPA